MIFQEMFSQFSQIHYEEEVLQNTDTEMALEMQDRQTQRHYTAEHERCIDETTHINQ